MAREITMPKLGQTSEEVHLLRWLVSVGDSVKKGDPLCEAENDKTTMDLESFTDGVVLKLLVPPDSVVVAGTVIALIGEPGESPPDVPVQQHTGGKPSPERGLPLSSAPPKAPRASRLVRNLAQKRNIDLATVPGSGPAGMITRKDLDAFQSPGTAVGSSARPAETAIPLSDQNLQLGRLMAASKARIPHYSLESTLLCDRLLDLRDTKRSRDGGKLSVDTFFIFAAASVLVRQPRINSSFREGTVHASPQIDIAFATSVNDELRAPVIRAADRKSLEEIDQEVRWLTAKARNDRLELADVAGATFTISNLGMYPIDSFQAIITPPQVAVLAIGRVRRMIDVDATSAFRVRSACTVWGSFDHRVVNGAQGAEFLRGLKQCIEEEI